MAVFERPDAASFSSWCREAGTYSLNELRTFGTNQPFLSLVSHLFKINKYGELIIKS